MTLTFQVFECKIYVLGEYESKETNFGEIMRFGHRHVIDKVFGPPNIEDYLQQELDSRPSKLLISGTQQHPSKSVLYVFIH